METNIYARPTIPNIIEVNGSLFEITMYEYGNVRNFSADDWTRIRQEFIKSIEQVNERRDGQLNFSEVDRIVLHLDTNSIQIWNDGENTQDTPSIFDRIHRGATLPLIEIMQRHQTDEHPKRITPPPIRLNERNTEDIETYESVALRNPQEAFAKDFREEWGSELYGESLAYYLNLYEQETHNTRIFLHGENLQVVMQQARLIEWSNNAARIDFDQWLEASATADNIDRIYIPFISSGHYQMIAIDKVLKEIVCYNPTGNFDTNEAHTRIIEKLQQSFPDYNTVSDDAFINGPHQQSRSNSHCGIYIVHFIHQMEQENKIPHAIFETPVTLDQIHQTRILCANTIYPQT